MSNTPVLLVKTCFSIIGASSAAAVAAGAPVSIMAVAVIIAVLSFMLSVSVMNCYFL